LPGLSDSFFSFYPSILLYPILPPPVNEASQRSLRFLYSFVSVSLIYLLHSHCWLCDFQGFSFHATRANDAADSIPEVSGLMENFLTVVIMAFAFLYIKILQICSEPCQSQVMPMQAQERSLGKLNSAIARRQDLSFS
jgi:hypothetical protein